MKRELARRDSMITRLVNQSKYIMYLSLYLPRLPILLLYMILVIYIFNTSSDKDANYVREKLEKDLYSTRVALQEKQKKKKSSTVRLGSDDSGVDGPQLSPHSTSSNSEVSIACV